MARKQATEARQAAQKHSADSAATARKQKADEMAAARQQKIDSTKAAQKNVMDTQNALRKKRTDSLNAIRKYKDSKRYKDSVAKARATKLAENRKAQNSKLEEQKAARQRVTDSAIAARKTVTDSLKRIQKVRSDKQLAVKKYKESKRYKDSVALFKQNRMDSLRITRKAHSDSLVAARKVRADISKDRRKLVSDSLMAVRKKSTDSLKNIRKAKTDSLAKVKTVREKEKKERVSLLEKKLDLALKLKIEKKHQAWSNETMLKKKWGVPRREIQNTFTRYNYFFNANRKMEEALDNMKRIKKENHDSLLALFAFNPNVDSSSIAPDMDSIIRKASVGIQIHDPRTKWGDDLYLLLGQAYYYKGDYPNAMIAFRYTISLYEEEKKRKAEKRGQSVQKGKEPSIMEEDKKSILDFLKHRTVHNEAILWLARTYTQTGQEGNAESVLDLVENDPNFPEELVGRLAVEKAFVKLNQGDYKSASKELTIAADDKNLPDETRTRSSYMNGQILQSQGQDSAAVVAYKKTLDLHPKIEMDFYTRKHLAYAIMNSGGSLEEAKSVMKKMVGDGKYVPYYEQIYYVLGMLEEKAGNRTEAIAQIRKGISSPKATKKQKAISFAALGDIYYKNEDYIASKVASDSASYFSKYVSNDTLVDLAVRRSSVLGEVTRPVMTIRDQDSLLRLSALNEKEQRAIVRKYIKMLENRRTDSIFKAENAGITAAQQADAGTEEQATAFYFSNSGVMQRGYNDFKMKWGNRPLVDNWRRLSAVGFVSNTNNANNPDLETATNALSDSSILLVALDENGIPTEEGLMAAIPNSDAARERSRKLEQRAYIDLANAYIRQLQDYPLAVKALDTLDTRYPQHDFKSQALYLRYLAALRQNQLDKAQGYSTRILQEFPSSQYAALVKPSEDGANMKNTGGQSVTQFYQETYDMLQQRQYTEVLQRVRMSTKQYPDPRYNGRFAMLEVSALAGSGEFERADSTLRDLMKTNAVDSVRNWADLLQKYINKNKKQVAPPPPPMDTTAKNKVAPAVPMPDKNVVADNVKKITDAVPQNKVTDTAQKAAAIKPATAAPTLPVPDKYTYDPKEEHYCIFVFPGYEARAMGVKAAMTDFNSFKFGPSKLSVSMDLLNARQGCVTTRSFPNMAQAKAYMTTLKATSQIFREYKPQEYKVYIISAANYRKLLSEKLIDHYANFYDQNYK